MKMPSCQGDNYQYFKEILSLGSERAVADIAVIAIEQKKERFNTVLQMCFKEKYPLDMRAARVIQLYSGQNPAFFIEDLESTMDLSLNSNTEGVRRNFLKILNDFVDFNLIINSGYLLNKCFDFVMDKSEKPAIRNYALQLLFKFSRNEKDIALELEEVIAFLEEESSVSFKNCLNNTLKKLKNLKKHDIINRYTVR